MAHKARVLQSFNDQGAQRCVDIFLRPDGTCGFEEFRRDPEDPRGWSASGGYAERVFADEQAATRAAMSAVQWLSRSLGLPT